MPNFLLRQKGISPGAKLTYSLLLSYAWQDDFCFPAQERLANDSGYSVRQVQRSLAELSKLGLITWKQRGLNRPNIYTILPVFNSAGKPKLPGHDNMSLPDTTPTSHPDTTPVSYYEDVKEKDTENNVNVEVIDEKTNNDAPNETTRGKRMNQNGSTNENEDEKARITYLVDEMATQLGDDTKQSRGSFRKIVLGLGEHTVWRLIGNTKEAYQDGIVRREKRAAYFTGMAKNIAQEQGVDIGFRKKGNKVSEEPERWSEDMRKQLNGLRQEIGNRSAAPDVKALP